MAPKRARSSSSASASRSRSKSVRARAASPSPSQPANHKQESSFFNLPVELIEQIYDSIPRQADRRRFAQSCRGLWLQFGAQWALERWKFEPTSYERRLPLFYFEDARRGERGYQPFFVIFVERVEGAVLMQAVSPGLEQLKRTTGDVHIVAAKYAELVHGKDSEIKPFELNFNERRFEMRSADSDWIRARFPCPVCDEKKRVKVGDKRLIKAYPAMGDYSRGKSRWIDCPTCTNAWRRPWRGADEDGDWLLAQLDKDAYDGL